MTAGAEPRLFVTELRGLIAAGAAVVPPTGGGVPLPTGLVAPAGLVVGPLAAPLLRVLRTSVRGHVAIAPVEFRTQEQLPPGGPWQRPPGEPADHRAAADQCDRGDQHRGQQTGAPDQVWQQRQHGADGERRQRRAAGQHRRRQVGVVQPEFFSGVHPQRDVRIGGDGRGHLGGGVRSRAQAVTGPLIGDPRLRKLSFTGSTAVGRQLLKQAADGILRTSMELGGNAPFLVFEDADLDAAVEGALLAKFRNIGQACTAANRFLVHQSVADQFTGLLHERVGVLRVGRGTEPGVDIGPLINRGAVQHAEDLVADAVKLGARVLTGGRPRPGRGTFFEPTLISGLPPQARMLREEIFAPLLGVTSFRDENEAVELANNTEYGLVGYAYTRSVGRAHRLIDTLATGMTGINTGLISNASAPFGGIKQSGLGREGGSEGIHEYLYTKYSLIPS